jgi:lipopolysaccharide export system permease protein
MRRKLLPVLSPHFLRLGRRLTSLNGVLRLLDRYLLRELIVPFGYCLGGFLTCWIAFDLFAEMGSLQEKKLGAADIFELYLVSSPVILALLLPVALLLALLYTLTNHSRHHEITAIRAAGVSLWRLSLPYFAVGFAATVSLFILNEFLVPDSEDAAEAIKRRYTRSANELPPHMVRNLGFTNSKEGRVWQIGIYDSARGEMIHPQVIWTQPDGSRLWIRAARAVHSNDSWVFSGARLFEEAAGADSELVPLPQEDSISYPFSETPEQIKSEIRISHTMTLRPGKRTEIPISAILHYLRLHPEPSESDAAWLFTKLHGRIAAPLTCMVVVLIALPFGAASGRRNVFVGVASSIVICFAYFMIQQFGLALGGGGYITPWLAAWFPNISFGLAGAWMTSRVR